jgi:hypothetical protein
MPKPMKVKIFMDGDAGSLEEQINIWLEDLSSAAIVKTETVVTAVAEKPDDGTYPRIVVTVWYEPPPSFAIPLVRAAVMAETSQRENSVVGSSQRDSINQRRILG